MGRDILLLPAALSDNMVQIGSVAAAGWRLVSVPDAVTAVAALRLSPFALICHRIDLPADAASLIAAQVAALPGPTPLLTIAPGRLLTPDDIDRHAVPATAIARTDPLARLTPLFGHDGVALLLMRFRARLAAVLDAPDPLTVGEGTTVAALAHRIAGMAGMLDFPELASAWAAVETGGARHWSAAWTETRIAHAMLGRITDRSAV